MTQLAIETPNSIDIGANLGYTIIACVIAIAIAFSVWAKNRPGSPATIEAEAKLERAKHRLDLQPPREDQSP